MGLCVSLALLAFGCAADETALETDVTALSLDDAELETSRAETAAGWQIRRYNTNLCLAIGGASTAPGARAIQWHCNGRAEQQWTFHPDYTIRNRGKCLAVGGGRQEGGAAVIQWPCTGGDEQKWIEYITNGISVLQNVNSGKCLSVGGDSTAAGTGIIQWQCDDRIRAGQMWVVE